MGEGGGVYVCVCVCVSRAVQESSHSQTTQRLSASTVGGCMGKARSLEGLVSVLGMYTRHPGQTDMLQASEAQRTETRTLSQDPMKCDRKRQRHSMSIPHARLLAGE